MVGCAMPTTVASSIAIALPSTVAPRIHLPLALCMRMAPSSATRAGHGLPEAAAVRACFGATPADAHAAPHAASILGAIVERPAALVIATDFEARPRAFQGRFDDGGADLPEEPRHARAGGHQLRATCGHHSRQ